MNNPAEIVSRCPWFSGVAGPGLDKLATGALIKPWAVGSCLYSTGESTRAIHCLLSGRARISITSALGHEFTIVDLEPESWTGQASLIGNQPRLLTAQIKDAAEVLSIPRKVVLEVAEDYPVLYKNLYHQEIYNSRLLYELMGGMLFYPLRVRLAGRLLHLLAEYGQEIEDGTLLETRLSQNDFAHLVMGSRQRVNKIFREWNEHGILSMQGDNYLVTDIEALRLELSIEEE